MNNICQIWIDKMQFKKQIISFFAFSSFISFSTFLNGEKKAFAAKVNCDSPVHRNKHKDCINKDGFVPVPDGIGLGVKYDWHVDQGSKMLLKGGSIRKISMTLFMNNPDEYEGGEFDLELFPPQKQPRYETFKLKKGSAIFFQSDVWHRVRPVSSGLRKSLVAWYSGPTFK